MTYPSLNDVSSLESCRSKKKKKKPKQNAPAYAKMFLSSPTSHPGSRFLTPVREGVCNVCSIEVNLSSRKQNDREAADIPVPYHM
jgi:hypothetical protein